MPFASAPGKVVSTYSYLHMILFNTLENDKRKLRLLMVTGWGLPFKAVTPYAGYRHHFHNSDCWMDLGFSSWFVRVPVLIIMIINLAMLINVIIVIRSKLQEAGNTNKRNSRSFTHQAAEGRMFPGACSWHPLLLGAHKSRAEVTD